MAVAFGMMKKQLLKCTNVDAMSKLYEEARVDFSNALKGRRLTKDTKKKISNARKGMKLSNKTKHKLSTLNSGNNHPLFGLHHSDETRKRMSKSHIGQIPWTKGKHWFTDGKTSVFANTCPTGFYKGRAKRT